MVRLLIPLLGILALSACAQPIPKSEITPVYNAAPPASVAIATTDHRSFILNGDKAPWFEGIMRGAYGIPNSLQRPGPKTGQPFAVYFWDMLASGLAEAGANTRVVTLPLGRTLEQAIDLLPPDPAERTIVIIMRTSRYDVGFSAEYNFAYDVSVLGPDQTVLVTKTFARFDTQIPLSAKYNVFDMYAGIYKRRLDEILADREIVAALSPDPEKQAPATEPTS